MVWCQTSTVLQVLCWGHNFCYRKAPSNLINLLQISPKVQPDWSCSVSDASKVWKIPATCSSTCFGVGETYGLLNIRGRYFSHLNLDIQFVGMQFKFPKMQGSIIIFKPVSTPFTEESVMDLFSLEFDHEGFKHN